MAEGNAETIERFYTAFGRQDGDAMAACYAPDVHFWDPVFRDLNGREAGGMWRMLTSRGGDLEIELPEHDATSAHWIARYTFVQTSRPVVNDIRASFRFNDDGLIADHRDEFDFYAWTKQALGPLGLALGWTPIVQGGVRKKARAQLDEFLASA